MQQVPSHKDYIGKQHYTFHRCFKKTFETATECLRLHTFSGDLSFETKLTKMLFSFLKQRRIKLHSSSQDNCTLEIKILLEPFYVKEMCITHK